MIVLDASAANNRSIDWEHERVRLTSCNRISPTNAGVYAGVPCNFHANVEFNLAQGKLETFGDYGLYTSCGESNVYNNLMYNFHLQVFE